MSADPPCTYDSTYYICSSTSILLIYIYIYSLHAVMNLATFLELLLNFCDLATLTCVLGHMNIATLSVLPSPTYIIIACSTASCFCCYQTTCFKLMSCQLIVYSGSGVVDDDDGGDSDAGGSN